MKGPLAAIDIGSNSVKLLVGHPTEGPVEVLEDQVVVTRLGEGVDLSGRLDPAAVTRTLAAIRGFVERCQALEVQRVVAVGTSALRDAAASPREGTRAFLDGCREFGLEVEVVNGEAEAEIVRLAALHEVPGLDGGAVLVDIGGGSTELVWGASRESTELGVVRLTERHVTNDPPGFEAHARLAEAVAARLAPLGLPQASALVGSSATCSLLARIHLGLRDHDPARIHGHRLPRSTLDAIAERLTTSSQAERLTLTRMAPRRADVLLAGTMVLRGVAEATQVDQVVVSDRGTRYGVFHRAFGSARS